ncbi:MAG: DUF6641 family protein [Aestuariivirga sp.]
MPILKSFQYVSTPDTRRTPEQHRRFKFIEKLKEQKDLLSNPGYSRTVSKWAVRDGNRVREPHQIRVKPWWTKTPEGKTVVMARFGLKVIEFEKGKPGILVEQESQLPTTFDALIDAANAGELDQLLAGPKPKAKKV